MLFRTGSVNVGVANPRKSGGVVASIESNKEGWKNDAVVTAYVYGEFGHGKTAYALWTAYEVLGDWKEVLNHLFFDPSPL